LPRALVYFASAGAVAHHAFDMSTTPVFCPKCGLQSTEGLRFCSRCGTNLETVSRALTGQLPAPSGESLRTEAEIEFAREWSKALGNLLTSVVVFTTFHFIFDAFWTWFLLIWVGFAVRDVVQAYLLKRTVTDPAALKAAIEASRDDGDRKARRKKRRERKGELSAPPEPVALESTHERVYSAPSTGEIAPPELKWEAGPPASVTEGTTRHLDDKAPDAPKYAPPQSR
jgi:hypothetical protein